MNAPVSLWALLQIKYSSEKDADDSGRRYAPCPHVALWAVEGTEARVVLHLPEDKSFWAEYIAEHPEKTFGGEAAALTFFDRVHRSPEPRQHKRLSDVSPCGSDCATCPAYESCPGCPATVHYKR
ncbi:MAG: hypothetical protein JSV27_08625 [Candidatus Bathyarchaeota archaeon]|nr:MAG: hypothetical protein JSV27_08625 [Candidatus Bathyarchaeota archaeon]